MKHSVFNFIQIIIAFASMLVIKPVANAQQILADVIPASSDVSSSGAFTYAVPLNLPPGIGEMMPSLSITYNSQGNNGLLGMGWSLSGLSSITRGVSTLYHNDKIEPVDFNNDIYYLDGQRLFPTAQSATTYYTEIKNYAIISSFTSGTTGSGPSHFRIEYPNGMVYQYGNTQSSKFLATGKPDVLMWALNKIEDQHGNYIEFNYYNDVTTGDYRVANIYYTGNSANGTPASTEIIFAYALRQDKNKVWIAGSQIRTNTILDYIQVEHNAAFVKKYQFTYGVDMYSHLTSIKEILPNNIELPPIDITWNNVSNGPSNVTTSLGHNSSPYEYMVGDYNGDGATDVAKYLVWSSPWTAGSVQISDKNDGFIDLPSDPIQHQNAYTLKQAKKTYNGLGSFYFDYDGDGDDDLLVTSPDVPIPSNVRMDFMLFKFDKNQNKMVYHSLLMRFAPPGNTSTAWVDRAIVVPGDYDGDGKTEILFGYPHIQNQSGMVISYDLYLVGEEYPTIQVGADLLPNFVLSNVGSVNNGHYNVFAMDMDGDGKDELVRAESNSLTTLNVYKIGISYNPAPSPGNPRFQVSTPANSLVSVHSNAFPNNYHYIYPGDFNGDGNGDMLVFALPNNNPGPQNGTWRIEYSKGNSFDVQSLPSNVNLQVQGPTYPVQQTYHVSDFNGDGKTDILQLYQAGSSTPVYDLYYSRGDNAFEHETDQLPTIHHDDVIAGDFNGDGQMDLLCHYGTVNTTPRIFYFNKNQNKHTVASISHADYTIDIETEYLSQDVEYVETANVIGGTLAYPFIERQIPIRVVKKVSDNVGSEQTYKYSNFIFNQIGLGIRGMMYTWKTDLQKSKIAVAEYNLLSNCRVPYLAKNSFWDLNTYNNVQNNALPPFPATKPITMVETELVDIDGGLSGKVVIPVSPNTRSYDFSKGAYTHTHLNNQNLNTGPGTAMYEFGLVPYKVTESYYNQAVNSLTNETFTYDMNAPFNARSKPTRIQTVSAYNGTSQVKITDFTYNSDGDLATTVMDPGTGNQVITSYTYNTFGSIATETATPIVGTAVTSSYTYTNDGRFVATSTNALNYVTQNQYDNVWGTVLQKTGIDGLTTTYEYDPKNRNTKITTPTGMETFYFYDWAINSFFNPPHTLAHEKPRLLVTTQVQGFAGSTLTFTDFYNRKIRGVGIAYDGSILYQDNKYNEKGLLIESIEPYGTLNANPVVTSYTYDDMDRLTGTTMSNNGPVSTISYNAIMPDYPPHGMETTTTIAGGITKTAHTNAMGQVLKVVEGSNTVEYGYHANGKYLDMIVNGNTQLTTQYTYDAFGRTLTMTEPNAGPTSYTYDPFNRVVTSTDANGTTFTYTYDVLGRVLSKIDNVDNIQYNYSYDNTPGTATTGKLMNTTSSAQAQSYDSYNYDQYGRMITHNQTEYEYDMYNRQTKYKMRGDAYLNVYNIYGFLEKVVSEQVTCSPPHGPCFTHTQTLWKANSINHRGQVTQAEYYDYQNVPIYTVDKSYDAFGYITNHTVTNNISSNVIYDYQYSFNKDNGNLDSRTDAFRSLTENFTYDAKERLTDVNYSNSITPLQMIYNEEGNMLKKSDVSTSIYDWKYDAYALVRVPEPQTSSPAHAIPINKQTVTYTPFKKAKVINEEVNRINITYNPFTEQRTLAQWYDINGQTLLLKTKVYHDQCEIYIKEINNPNQTAVWSHYVPAYGDNVAIIERKTHSQSPWHTLDDTGIHFTVTDHLGSLVMILDNEGLVNDGVLEERSFDAWGRTRDINTWIPDEVMQSGVQFNPGWMVDRGYTFHEHYWENGIINMNGRLYDPLAARMFSPDPANVDNTNTEAYNKYSYVLNNPLKYTDPSGNEAIAAAIVVGAYIGMVSNVAMNFKAINNSGGFFGYALVGAVAGGASGYAGVAVAGAIGIGGAVGGAATGAVTGGVSGFITGTGNAYVGGASFGDGLVSGLKSAGLSSITGAVAGGVMGGVESLIDGRNFWTGEQKVADQFKAYFGYETYRASPNGLQIEIHYNKPGNFTELNWIQTVETDFPINGQVSPFIDGEAAYTPFYNTPNETNFYLSKGHRAVFHDQPGRDFSKPQYYWKAELSLMGRRGSGDWHRITSYKYGWEWKNNQVFLNPLQSKVPPSQLSNYHTQITK